MSQNSHARWALVRRLLSGHASLFSFVFATALVSALAEGLGLAIVYPVLGSIMGTDSINGSVWQRVYSAASVLSGGSPVEGLLVLMVIVFFVKSILLIVNSGAQAVLIGRLRADWSTRALARYLYGPFDQLLGDRQGRIFHNVAKECGRAAGSTNIGLQLAIKLIFAIVLVATLFLIHWEATLVFLGVVMLVAFAARSFLYERLAGLGRRQITINQRIASLISEPISAAPTVKLFGGEDRYMRGLRRQLRKFTRNDAVTQVLSDMPNNLAEFFVVTGIVGILFILSIGYGLTLREAVPIIGAFAVVSFRLVGTLAGILSKRLRIATLWPSFALVDSLIANAPHARDHVSGEQLTAIEGDIEFRNVSFAHKNSGVLFERLSLTIPRGRMVGIVGKSGVGKSTLVRLLGRLFDPTEGSIVINGRDYREYSLSSLRQSMGFVEQDPVIFHDTVYENIRFGKPDASREEIVAAAKAANADQFITELPEGYDTLVGDRGAKLSGGERQRIAIARAIVRKPDVFVFDEATSALDRGSEELIQNAIERLATKATVIVIAHRVTTLKRADLIYELLPGGAAIERTYKEIAA